jgi:hypothetical protein
LACLEPDGSGHFADVEFDGVGFQGLSDCFIRYSSQFRYSLRSSCSAWRAMFLAMGDTTGTRWWDFVPVVSVGDGYVSCGRRLEVLDLLYPVLDGCSGSSIMFISSLFSRSPG